MAVVGCLGKAALFGGVGGATSSRKEACRRRISVAAWSTLPSPLRPTRGVGRNASMSNGGVTAP
ncbi:hypothetical protein E2562_002304 [Oryza meyeriana var. granulata]|uniref:Uncharacterized protein n=1 Tax=Oryza meyeriana var. granulata TaxID=110450 RepID=A0A6G1BGX8_9ORYZ|nr:hypothetical protein E2562_002304 [Oryza meyeriana var. granulata]